MYRPHNFWQALEDVHGHCATLMEWRRRLGCDYELVRDLRFLHPVNKFAESVPISDDLGVMSYRVFPLDRDRVEAISEDGGDQIVIAKADVLLYRVEFRALCREIAEALGFVEESDPISDVPEVHPVGSYRPFAGHTFPALLACPNDEQAATQSVEALLARVVAPFLFIVPTGRTITRNITELLAKRKAACIKLTEAVEGDTNGTLVRTQFGERDLLEFRDDTIPQAKGDPPHAFFPTPSGARWSDLRIKFVDQETISIRIGEVTKIQTYVDVGLVDRRNGRPDVQWKLLYEFARDYGFLTWDSAGASRKNQARRDALVSKLKSFFRIEGEPIGWLDRPNKGWRTAFSVERE
jgi:hypothetical protein